MRIVSDIASKLTLPDDREIPRFEVMEQTVVISEGSIATETRESAVVEVLTSAVVDTQAVIQPEGFTEAPGWWFQSSDASTALADRNGQVTRVSDGTVWIDATDGRFCRRYTVTVSRDSPPEVVRLMNWVDGSVEGFDAEQIGDMTDGVTASTATRSLFVGGVRNASLFCATYVEALTAITQTSSRFGSHIGLTAITPRHVLGCQHALHATGDTLTWKTAANATVTRLIEALYFIPGKDACVYVLDADLPETITAMAVPPPDLLDYIRHASLGYPLLFTDRDNIASVALSTLLTDTSFMIKPPPVGSPLRPFYTHPVEGTSGHRLMMPWSATGLMVMGTFTNPAFGPSYHALDWSAIIAAADAAAGISTEYVPEVADLSGFTNYSWDAEVRDYFIRLEAVSSISNERKVAVNTLVTGLKADGLWEKIKAMCLLAGPDDLTGALVPLVGAAPANNGFVSGDYNPVTGLKGNGSKYLDTNRANNADPQNNNHVAVLVTEGGSQAICGANQQGRHLYDGYPTSGEMWISNNCVEQATPDDTDAVTEGFIGLSRGSSTGYDFRRNGTTHAISQGSTAHLSQNMFIFARPGEPYNGRIAVYSLGEALDLAAFDARVTDFRNSL